MPEWESRLERHLCRQEKAASLREAQTFAIGEWVTCFHLVCEQANKRASKVGSMVSRS